MPNRNKQNQLPARYDPGFLEKLDGRKTIYRRLRRAFDEIVDDAGGPEKLSHAKLSLIKRFVFLESVLAELESRLAQRPKDSAELLSRWIQGLNSLIGLGRAIGLERTSKRTITLKTYVEKAK